MPSSADLDVIGDWWSLLIIRDTFNGVRRFSEFQRGLGIAKGTLATRLRNLTEPRSFPCYRRTAAMGRGLSLSARRAKICVVGY